MVEPIPAPDPPLRGDGILLRRWDESDAAALVRIVSDPEVPRWTYLPEGMTLAQARHWIGRGREVVAQGGGIPLAVVDHSTGELLGNVGLGQVDARMRTGEIFWWLDRAARGRGVATTAVRLVAAWALGDLGLARLAARIEPANVASVTLARRVGFTFEGVLRSAEPAKDGDGRIDLGVWSLLPGELE